MIPTAFLAIGPSFAHESEVYLFLGAWQDARARIASLGQRVDFDDVMPAFGVVNIPVQNATISGLVSVAGWALDDRGVGRVEILLDGAMVGAATYGSPRPDVARDYPGLPRAHDLGFSHVLDSHTFANGSHVLEVRAVDTSQNSRLLSLGKVTIKIQN